MNVFPEVVQANLQDLFEGLDAGESVALAEEIGNRLPAGDRAIRVLDELDAIITAELIADLVDSD